MQKNMRLRKIRICLEWHIEVGAPFFIAIIIIIVIMLSSSNSSTMLLACPACEE